MLIESQYLYLVMTSFHSIYLQRWATNRQMRFEGGFQGRTNKLVDGCYSFWQGALFPLLHFHLAKSGDLIFYIYFYR